MPKIRKPHTLRRHLAVPLLAIVVVQALLYCFVFLRMSVLTQMDDNAYDIFSEQTRGRQVYLQNEMVHRWSSLDQGRDMAVRSIEQTLADANRTAADLRGDSALAQEAVAAAADDIVYLLRKNGVTGAFLILDAPGLADDAEGATRAGFYVRDLDPSAYSADNSDLLLERAMPALSKTLRLPLDSYWNSVFSFRRDGSAEERFFFEPLRAAREQPGQEASALGYWSALFSLPGDKTRIVTYSQPLLGTDGSVLGVLGVDVTESYLAGILDHSELGLGMGASYVLGTLDGGVFTPMLTTGGFYRSAAPLSLTATARKDIYDSPLPDATVCLTQLQLYNADSPFSSEQWTLASVASTAQLLHFSHDMRTLTLLSIMISLLCAICALLVLGQIVTSPIKRLAGDLGRIDPTRPVSLPKTHIDEIDRLSCAVEDLSSAVADSSSKFSEIIRLTGLPVGVFEFIEGSPTAFCSRTLCDLLCWPEAGSADVSLPIETFSRRLTRLAGELSGSGDPHLRCFQTPTGETRWVRIIHLAEGQNHFGSIVDVTRDVLEKQKIEFERDYDSLSRLYNRRAFERELTALFTAPEGLGHAALVMFDLDNLKYLNDTYGHDCGDQYITAFSSLLSGGTPPHCVTARRSGDEFYAFYYGYDSREALHGDIDTLYRAIRASSLTLPSGLAYRMRASGGVAYYPDDARSYDDLIRYADFAMYNVKHTAKGNLQDFDAAQYRDNAVLLHGQDALDRLLDHEQVQYAFQPIVDVHSCKIYGYEMLMRSLVPELPSVDDVLRLARTYSKLPQIEHLTLFKGMETFAHFAEAGKLAPNSYVFLNSIASQRMSAADEALFYEQYSQYYRQLVLEITENDPYDAETARAKIDHLRALGARIALDDYGSGYNSDAVLLFLTPEIVKIDLSIVRGIDKDPNRQSVLEYLVSFAKSRNILVLAEGVETIDELQYVVTHGADLLQGYYLARPAIEPQPIAPQILDVVRRALRERLS